MSEAEDGYLPVHVDKVLMSDRGGVVLLSSDREPFLDRVLPVFVDTGQAVNIQLALTSELPPRPFTHDLLTTILNQLGALVLELRIDELAQNTFFSTIKIEVERGNGSEPDLHSFDARPSDGIALALRANAPILVRREVLDNAAVDPDEFFGQIGAMTVEDLEDEDEDKEPIFIDADVDEDDLEGPMQPEDEELPDADEDDDGEDKPRD